MVTSPLCVIRPLTGCFFFPIAFQFGANPGNHGRRVGIAAVRSIGVRRARRTDRGRAVRPPEARLLDGPRRPAGVGAQGAGRHAAGRPAGRPDGGGPVPGRGRRRAGPARRRPAVRAGARHASGRGRHVQRRVRGRRGRPLEPPQPRAVRDGRPGRGRRAADHGRVRGRADHVAGGRGEQAAHRDAVDGGAAVRGHGGSHLRVRPADDPFARQNVRRTLLPDAVVVVVVVVDFGLFRRVRFVVVVVHQFQGTVDGGRRG